MRPDRNLDILRSMAVFTVLVAHLRPASPLQEAIGHYGVLIFFVHTSLVLLLSLERQMDRPRFALRFYIQRVFRIYPLSILCVLVTLAFRISWPDPVFHSPSGLSIAANLLLVQNFLHDRFSVSPPLWSLPFEVQMYAVLPFVFWLLRERRMRVAITLLAIALALPVCESQIAPLGGLWITRYFPCFLSGGLAYCGYKSGRCLRWWLWPVFIAGLGAVYSIMGAHAPADWLICIVLGSFLPLFREAPGSRLSQASGLVAQYSYGIYLAHAPLIWLCFQRLTLASMTAGYLLFTALLCVVPVVLYHFVEKPAITAGKALSLRILPEPDTTGSALCIGESTAA